jgi:hypothetical protein
MILTMCFDDDDDDEEEEFYVTGACSIYACLLSSIGYGRHSPFTALVGRSLLLYCRGNGL